MSYLIKNALLLTMQGDAPTTPVQGDIAIVDGVITAIGTNVIAPEGAEIIDATGCLVMPGLVNAHLHSNEMFYRGRYERMPLEVWLLYAYPFFAAPPLDLRLLYLRTMLVAIESLRSGVTMISDDFFDPPMHDLERLATVFKAYGDSGIRANVASGLMNLPYLDTISHAREIIPPDVQKQLDFPVLPVREYLDFCDEVFRTLHGAENGRLRFMLAPSGPQRCSIDLMQACRDLAIRYAVPYHTHVLETKVQAVTAQQQYGKTLIRHMADLDLLHPGVLMAHAVWVTDEDIVLMGQTGVSVSYNTLANLKLGSGLCPVRRLLDAGVNIGLGTDGASSNDTMRIFDVMRSAALVQNLGSPQPQHWMRAEEILHAATLGGARAALLDKVTGSLAVGKQADLLFINLTKTTAFTPLSDVVRQLVYGENGQSVQSVMVAGRFVIKDGHFTTIDEAALLEEIRAATPALLAQHQQAEANNAFLEPYFTRIYQRCLAQDIGLSRHLVS